uniref:Myticalin A8 n=1 Tax=Mytilus trossulus TaxID=6551 RepID=A0A286RMU4_MYTTR|nr:myticalin A8 [Mytilus trossulus]
MKRNVLLLLVIISTICLIHYCDGYSWPRMPRIPRLPRYPRYPRYPRWPRHPTIYAGRKRATLDNGIQDEDIEIQNIEDGHIYERNVNMNDDATNDIDDSFMNDVDDRDVNDIDERDVNDIDESYVDGSQNDE